MTLLEEPIVLVGFLIAILFAVLSYKRIGSFVSVIISALFLFASASYGIICGIDVLEIASVFLVILIILIAGTLKKDEPENQENKEEKK